MKRSSHLPLLLLAIAAMVSSIRPALAVDYPAPANMSDIIAAAKKEGSVTLYTSLAAGDSAPVIKRFEDKYGIKVNLWRGSADNVLQRVVTEANGRKYNVDVAHIQTDNMEALSREQLLLPVESPTFKDLVPGAVQKQHEWAIAQITLYVMAYNTNLIKKADLPRSYKDLLDPKWKGKLGIESTDSSWLQITADHLGGDAGLILFRDIKARNGFSVRTGHSLLANLVAAGEVPLALNVYQYKAIQLKRAGAPVDWFSLEPALASTNAIGIFRHAAHPNAARLYYEFMLTEGQEVMASVDDVPSNVRVASPLSKQKITFIDPQAALDNRAKWEERFNDIVNK
ncbi:extracellular solute-binding protein [Oxalobacteraceae bacterium CAVE-383]|nr:extracellular solute-binding protein [Oxalobacteraceae bacterium CAVE-383]